MKPILLIYPKTGVEFKLTTPFSLLFVAAFLVQKNYPVILLDQRLYRKNDFTSRLAEAVQSGLQCVGISSMTGPQITYGLEISQLIKRHNKSLPVIWGGIHPTLLPEQTLQNDSIDIVCRHEGEQTIVDLAEALSSGSSLAGVQGISYKDSYGKISHNDDRPFIDPDDMPRLPYELLEMNRYVSESEIGKSVTLYTSKGCPHECAYCYNEAFNRRTYRAMGADRIVQDIQWFVETFHVESIAFSDDNFFVNKKRVAEFCRAIKERKLRVYWYADCRVDYLLKYDQLFIQQVYDAGLRQLFIGAESGCNRVLQLIHKGHQREDIISVNRMLAASKIQPIYSFMIGFPDETKEEMYETISLIDQLIADNENAIITGLNCWNPYPGTELFNMAEREMGMPSSLEEWGNMTSWYKTIKRENRTLIENICFVSNFVTAKKTKIPKLMIDMYLPFARWRWRKRVFGSCVDTFLFNLIKA